MPSIMVLAKLLPSTLPPSPTNFLPKRLIILSMASILAFSILLFTLPSPTPSWTLSFGKIPNLFEEKEMEEAKSNGTKCAADPDFVLRIMPLGASITMGKPAAPNDTARNGYRGFLREELRADGFEVDMVGSVKDYGSMIDRENEGHPGWTINNILEVSKNRVSTYKPNIILLNIGTNDAVFSKPSSPYLQAPIRMAKLLSTIWSVDPDIFIVLSTLLANKKVNERIQMINYGYRELARNLTAAGKPMMLAEMNAGEGKTVVGLADLWDGTHPYVEGYRKMAGVWYQALKEGICWELIKEPKPGNDEGIVSD